MYCETYGKIQSVRKILNLTMELKQLENFRKKDVAQEPSNDTQRELFKTTLCVTSKELFFFQFFFI